MNEIDEIIDRACTRYKGDFRQLKSAIGTLILGEKMGWEALRVMVSRPTYRKYEKILAIRFEDICPARGTLSKKSEGLKQIDALTAKKGSVFWKVVKGRLLVERKTHII